MGGERKEGACERWGKGGEGARECREGMEGEREQREGRVIWRVS
jgi:hypothetical protein